MRKEDYTNKQGYCPKCGGGMLDYEAAKFEDDMMYFPYVCNNCEQEGEEWYSLNFDGHNIYTEEGGVIAL